jgi:hypothetical protein
MRAGSDGRCNTPSVLIQQCFSRRSDLCGCPRSKPSQGGVPADLAERAFLAFVFNLRRVRAECCVDPLKPPPLPDKWRRDDHGLAGSGDVVITLTMEWE